MSDVLTAFFEPIFLDHFSSWLNPCHGLVIIYSVQYHTKSHDSDAVFGCEMSVSAAHGDPFFLGWFIVLTVLAYIEVTRQVFLSVYLSKCRECFIGDIVYDQLVVSGGKKIVVDIFENGIRNLAIGLRGVAQTIAIV